MDKAQALHFFWSSFGLPAYDENTVPDDAQLPYITYNVATDSLDGVLPLSGTIWYKGRSWAEITAKSEEIAEAIASNGFVCYPIDKGYLWIEKGTPFAQRIREENDDQIRRMYINITAEFLTAW